MHQVWRTLLPWAVPILAAGVLWAANSVPDVTRWLLPKFEQAACSQGAQHWQMPELQAVSDCRIYRTVQTLDSADSSDAALLINSMSRDGRVVVNGLVLREPDPSPDSAYNVTPFLINLPAGTLRHGDNEVLIQLRSGRGLFEYRHLGKVYLGPRVALSMVWQRNWVIGPVGAKIALIISFAITLFLLPIAWVRRHETMHQWFALTVVASAIFSINYALPWRPMPLSLWSIFVHAMLALSLWGLIKFSHRFVGLSKLQRERIFGSLLIASVACLTLASMPGLDGSIWFELFYRASQLGMLGYLIFFWWRQRARATEPSPLWFASSITLLTMLGLFDSMTALELTGLPLKSYTLHWGSIYMLMLFFVALVIRIARALREAEGAQTQLVSALADRTAELETEFVLRREAQLARILAEERQRIMQDMHDGVGGQLVALIGQARSEGVPAADLERQLRHTLDDLRLMIDSLDVACSDLSVAMGMLRHRIDGAFARLPIKIEWRTAHLPDLQPVSPTVVLNVMRIVQEAITNALKHARPSTIRIHARLAETTLQLVVEDDGCGFSTHTPGGRGLANIRQRASLINAKVDVKSGSDGTRVTLDLEQNAVV